MIELENFSEAQLTAELSRRAAVAQDREDVARRERFRNVLKHRAALLALFPEHGRTSCSDTNVMNGFWTRSDNGPRCTRCALLEMAARHEDDFDVDFTLDFRHVDR